ncbi:MAG: hypothetical protein H8E15_16495 [Planctomycetes bacterium]|nr:hypothetical protein [Planctomycetota bacterium]
MLCSLLAILPLLGHVPETYPIDPISLRQFCESADVIVIGVAGEPEPVASADDEGWRDYSMVDLILQDCLRGGLKGETVTVRYLTGMICPTPAHFEAGKLYLVFADEEENGMHSTQGLSYGVKELTPVGANAYKLAIQEWERLNKLKDRKAQKAGMVEWLVGMAENQHTRWEGAIELNQNRYLPTEWSKNQWPFRSTDLNAAQIDRLLTLLATTKSFDWKSRELFRAFENDDDVRVTRYMVNLMASWKNSTYGDEDILLEALSRTDSVKGRALFDRYWKIEYGDYFFVGRDTMRVAVINKIARILQAELDK